LGLTQVLQENGNTYLYGNGRIAAAMACFNRTSAQRGPLDLTASVVGTSAGVVGASAGFTSSAVGMTSVGTEAAGVGAGWQAVNKNENTSVAATNKLIFFIFLAFTKIFLYNLICIDI
jgi:hypothetical protein